KRSYACENEGRNSADAIFEYLRSDARASLFFYMKTAEAQLEPKTPSGRHPAAQPVWRRKDLLSLEELSREAIFTVLEQAAGFKEISTRSIKKAPTLRGKVVLTLFYEPSTRTRASFSLAAQRLSADVLELDLEASSAKKGETLVDTARNLRAMGVDVFVIR